ncbi:crotonase/enoyl-CoA hydratase family protein [Reinekea marinisedimentorum]|uniref:Enoyl-CoA hydratase/carnithine racemase n=1 Tax=Reinekea marinisedimentorum TaxID=230495 RepID=A0A4V6NY22_9GAMM|nr:crotonase/enoyl-CoA hydratase family protein [Reinekea marinisedimentorum]TCS39970.1 enoyl-CoA hydratase/carnithine racemase [Reinekea marinisedimentorum]
MDESNRVLVSVEGGIARVSLNRPDKHNGLDQQMMTGLIQAAKSVARNRSVRVVVLTGNGPSFCSGLDFSYVSKNPGMVPRFFIKWPWAKDNGFQRVANIWRKVPVPVIAALHGNCFGGALQIALACDYRIAQPDARFSIMEMKWGIIPDMSATVTLPRLTSLDIAQELTMTGRVFSAQEAKEYGLISRLAANALEEACDMAGQIAQNSPDAIAAAKYLYRKTWNRSERTALFWERWVQLKLLGRKNQRIAMHNGLKGSADQRPFVDRRSF